MTNAPPPQMPPPDYPPPSVPEKPPGFLVCGLMFFGALVALSFIGGAVSAAVGAANGATAGGIITLIAIGFAIYFSVKDERFRRCFLRGLVVNLALGAIVFGACLALVASMY